MAHFFIKHKTEYIYSDVIFESAYKIKLYPLIDDYLKLINHNIQVSFNPIIETFVDFNQNIVGSFSIVEPHKKFIIESYLEVITSKKSLPKLKGTVDKNWELLNGLKKDINFIDFLLKNPSKGDSFYNSLLSKINILEKQPQDIAVELCEYVYKNFKYTKNVTTVNTTIDEVWDLKAGVCQDFAHVLIHILKMANIPAKYVSGYICSNENGLIGLGATHAWVEAYIPNYGWLGLDPTNNCIVSDKHVKIATGRNYFDCAPVDGIYRGTATNKLNVEVEVRYDEIKKPNYQSITEKITEFKKNSYKENQQYIQEQQQQQ